MEDSLADLDRIVERGRQSMANSINAKDCKLRELNLSGRYLGYVGIEPLVTMLLKKKNILQKLKVARNGFGDRGVESIASLGADKRSVFPRTQSTSAETELSENILGSMERMFRRPWL